MQMFHRGRDLSDDADVEWLRLGLAAQDAKNVFERRIMHGCGPKKKRCDGVSESI